MIRTTPRLGVMPAALLFSVCIGLTSTCFARSGSIAGQLVDSGIGETLIGANVVIEGTVVGSSTDLDGFHTIPDVEPGAYTLIFSYIGYTQATVTAVEVLAGETTTVNLALTPVSFGFEEVVVEACAPSPAHNAGPHPSQPTTKR